MLFPLKDESLRNFGTLFESSRLFVLTFEQPCADGKIVSFLTGRSASSYSWAENLWAARGCSMVGTPVSGDLLFSSNLLWFPPSITISKACLVGYS